MWVGLLKKLSTEELMFWTVVLEKTLEIPLDCKEIKPVHPKGDQSWVFIGRADVEAETPILWPPDVKNWLIWKDHDPEEDGCWEEKGMTGWDGWMASLAQWTWVWVGSGSWWWTVRPGVLQSMGLQRVRHDWATELYWHCKLTLARTHIHTHSYTQTPYHIYVHKCTFLIRECFVLECNPGIHSICE